MKAGASRGGGFGHLFTTQAASYAHFRPDYPASLYQRIWSFAGEGRGTGLAVDVGCGTGQATKVLATHFDRVVAFDPSPKQVEAATKIDNVEYRVGLAEALEGIEDESVDLLTTAQAAHWFQLEPFYRELDRVLKPKGCVAIWGYGLCRLPTPEADKLLSRYHTETLGPYWEKKRALVDALYEHIQLPFARTHREVIENKKEVPFKHFVGYLGTWSSLKTFREKHPEGSDPVQDLCPQLFEALQLRSEEDVIHVTFPTVLILGQK